MGGKQLGWWVVGTGEWDFAILAEGDFGDVQNAATLLATNASGAFERVSVIGLIETADADNAL